MLARLFDAWAGRRQHKELSEFLSALRAMDSDEIGLVVACAYDWRNQMLKADVDLLYPALLLQADGMVTFRMSRQVAALQKRGMQSVAAGLIIWVHTLRSMTRLELRQLGRDMWGELARGFWAAEQAAEDAYPFLGVRFDTTGCGRFPDGLTPEPR